MMMGIRDTVAQRIYATSCTHFPKGTNSNLDQFQISPNPKPRNTSEQHDSIERKNRCETTKSNNFELSLMLIHLMSLVVLIKTKK